MVRRTVALLALLLLAAPAPAILDNPIKLGDIIGKLPTIFVAEVDSVDADKATAVFLPKDDLKGKCEFPRLPVNLKDGVTAAGKKADHTKVILDRLAKGRKLILFVKPDGAEFSAWGFVEGTWFQLAGIPDKDDKGKVRWAFLNCEPALRGTFTGTTEELRALVADVLAGKAKAPAPDPKEKPGFGPTVEEEKKEKKDPTVSREATPSAATGGPLFGVIPSTVFVAPLAVLAALFPATFGGLANGVKRWRAFMAVVSVNGILAAVYFFTQKYLPNEWWASPTAVTALLLLVVLLGLLWSGSRYRAAVAADPAEADPPTHKDVLALLAFAAASVLLVFAVVYIGQWVMTGSPLGLPFGEVCGLLFQLPTRELTAGIVGLLAAAAYLGYRTRRSPAEPDGSARTRVAGETFALTAMLLFGGVMLVVGLPRQAVSIAGGVEVQDAPVTLTDGGIWFEAPDVEKVYSAVTLTPTHAYFGGEKDSVFRKGVVVCVNRATGKQEWAFSDRELRTVYSTPVVVGNRVYVGEGLHTDPLCRLLCLNAETGEKVWEFRTQSHTEGMPAVANGRVYFSAGDDGVFCLDSTGNEVWHYRGREQGLHVDSAVTVADGRVYAGSGYGRFAAFCLDANTGAELWKQPLPYRSFGNPLVSGDRVFFGIGTGRLSEDLNSEVEPGVPPEREAGGGILALSATNGETVWRHDLPRSVHTQIVADAVGVYAASRDGRVYGVSRESGRRLWRFSYGTPLPKEVASVGNAAAAHPGENLFLAVYSVHPLGRVQAHHPLTGEVFWTRGIEEYTDRVAEVASNPTVEVNASGTERQVFVPVTLKNKNNEQTRAAVLRFVDRLKD